MMAEGGKIDWAAHSNDLPNTIFETIDMADAIEVAYQFYLKHPKQTLIIVTADHETGGISVGRGKGYSLYLNHVDSIKAQKSDVSIATYMNDKTALDSLSIVSKIGWTTTSHTGGGVPVYAIGAHSDLFAGRMDNTEIPHKICDAMGVKF